MLSFLLGERLSKMSLKSDIVAKIAELSTLVDSIVEPVDPSEQIAQLQAEIVAKDAVIADQASKLAQADLLAKQIDALSPDA